MSQSRMPQTMTEVDDFRKTINQASIEAIFQFAMHRDFHGIGVERLNAIGLFEADQNLQGGEGERLCCVNDWTAGAVPAGRGVNAALTTEGLFPGPCKDRRPDAEYPHAG